MQNNCYHICEHQNKILTLHQYDSYIVYEETEAYPSYLSSILTRK